MTTFQDLPAGDDRTLNLRAAFPDGTPVNLTGATLRLVLVQAGRVALSSLSTDGDALVALGADPADGQYVVTLPDSVTAELPLGRHSVEVKARLASGSALTLLRDGQLDLVASAIRDKV